MSERERGGEDEEGNEAEHIDKDGDYLHVTRVCLFVSPYLSSLFALLLQSFFCGLKKNTQKRKEKILGKNRKFTVVL